MQQEILKNLQAAHCQPVILTYFVNTTLGNKHFNVYLYVTSIRCETQNNKITLFLRLLFSVWLRHSHRWKKGNIVSKLCGI